MAVLLTIFSDSFYSDLIIFFLGVASAVITFFVTERIKSKALVFIKKISYQTVGMSSQSETWGDIKITWNDAQFNNIYFFTVEIINDTSKNAPKDMVIQFSVDIHSLFLNQTGLLLQGETRLELLLEDKYFKLFQDINKRWFKLPENERNETSPLFKELDPILRNKKFVIPVLNSKNSLVFNFLVVSSTPDIPVITPFIFQEGVTLEWDKSASKKKREKLWTDILITFLWALSVFPILSYAPSKTWVAWLLVISSFVTWGLAHGIVYLLKSFRII